MVIRWFKPGEGESEDGQSSSRESSYDSQRSRLSGSRGTKSSSKDSSDSFKRSASSFLIDQYSSETIRKESVVRTARLWSSELSKAVIKSATYRRKNAVARSTSLL
jgi:hypothetical protein